MSDGPIACVAADYVSLIRPTSWICSHDEGKRRVDQSREGCTRRGSKFNIHDHLKAVDEQVAYLPAAAEEDDPTFIAAAIGDVATARGVDQFATETGLSSRGDREVISAGRRSDHRDDEQGLEGARSQTVACSLPVSDPSPEIGGFISRRAWQILLAH